MMMKKPLTLIDHYIFTQLFLFSVFGTSLFTILWITPEILYKTIRHVILFNLPVTSALQIILLNIPDILIKSIPIGLMVGALLSFDKFSRNSEYIAFRTLGLTMVRLSRVVIYAGLLGFFLIVGINEALLPKATSYLNAIKNDVTQEGKYFTYIQKTPSRELQEIHIGSREHDTIDHFNKITILTFTTDHSIKHLNKIITAQSGVYQTADRSWHLKDVTLYTITEKGVYSNIVRKPLLIYQAAPEMGNLLKFYGKNPKELTSKQTFDFINLLDRTGQDDDKRYMAVRLHQKFAQPFSCILFVFTGMLLGIHFTRSVKVFGYTTGMALIFIYYTLWPFSSALGYIGTLPPFLAAWLPNIIVMAVAVLLFRKLS